jgi:hypothetical protein
MTGCSDPLEFGEGMFTAFREPKRGVFDACYDAFCPVRWCTFAEPVSVYSGAQVHFEAVLANEDTLRPGTYPAHIRIVGPGNRLVVERDMQVTVAGRSQSHESPFAVSVFAEDIPIMGPTGQYRFLVTFQQGVAATGGETTFYVADPADMPQVEAEVVPWADDPELTSWLTQHGIRTRPYQAGPIRGREVILVSAQARDQGSLEAWRDLAAHIAQGSTAIFLVPEVFRRGDAALGWLPLAHKGDLSMVHEYTFPQVYPKDEWAKRHALFDGLPCGGLMDFTFYREIIPERRFAGQDTPDEAVAGSFRTSHPGAYACDTMLAVHALGSGRFVLNALRVREELGHDPAAERLLRNMLRYAARDVAAPPAALPEDFLRILQTIGY